MKQNHIIEMTKQSIGCYKVLLIGRNLFTVYKAIYDQHCKLYLTNIFWGK